MQNSFPLKAIFLGLILYLVSAGTTYAAMSYIRPSGDGALTGSGQGGTTADKNKLAVKKKPDLPKTEECPINGAMYSKPEREAWEKRRPMGVMVENSAAARPQSGLSLADVVYEAVAEGGITRFMAVFYCQDAEVIGPIRSARTYYLDWISEYGLSPLYVHVGGANTEGPADALGQIERYGWGGYNDLNQFSIGFPTFYRDYDRLGKDTATEHTVYASSAKLWSFAATKRQLTNVEIDDLSKKEVPWNKNFVSRKFKDDLALDQRPQAFSLSFGLSNTQASYMNDYTVTWNYDRISNSFLRVNGDKPHIDLDTNQQITAKNIVIQFQAMSVADDNYSEEGHGQHTLYANKGVGKAAFLIDGKMTNGTWKKKDRVSRTEFFDQTGAEVKFNRGALWIETLPVGQVLKQS